MEQRQNKEERLTIRVTPELKAELFDRAKQKGLSTSALATIYISNGLKADSQQKDLLEAVKMALQNPDVMNTLIEAAQTKLDF